MIVETINDAAFYPLIERIIFRILLFVQAKNRIEKMLSYYCNHKERRIEKEEGGMGLYMEQVVEVDPLIS